MSIARGRQEKARRPKMMKRLILAGAGAAVALSIAAGASSSASPAPVAGSYGQPAFYGAQSVPYGPQGPVTAMAVRWQ